MGEFAWNGWATERSDRDYEKIAEAYAREGFPPSGDFHQQDDPEMVLLSRRSSERLVRLYAEKVEGASLRFLPFPLFRNWMKKNSALLPVFRRQTFPKDALVCREGEAGDSLFVITQERSHPEKSSQEKEREISRLKEGDFFGEFGFHRSKAACLGQGPGRMRGLEDAPGEAERSDPDPSQNRPGPSGFS